MNIAFFETEPWEQEYFKGRCSTGCTMTFSQDSIDHADFSKMADVDTLVIFIYSQITKEILDKLPNLKFISTMSMGFDHIDLAECKTRNIVVANVPTYGENTVAEHAFALMLALSRRIIDSYKKLHDWQFGPAGLTGFDLCGKTLGVLGVGNIGKNVVKIGNGFGMNVIGYKRSPDPALEKELNFKIVDMDTLFAQSDVISVHLPYTKETHHLLDTPTFEKMKKGVVIINTARGAIINTQALVEALNSGQVGFAGLDVLEEEPLLREEKELLSKNFDQKELLCVLENHMLLTHPNVLVTPHNAFNSKEALEKIVGTTFDNITSFTQGKPVNVVAEK